MRSASRLYRLGNVVAALGVGAVALAAIAALPGLRFGPDSVATLLEACSSVLPSVGAAGYLALGLTVVAAASVTLGIRSLVRQLRATRGYLRDLGPTMSTVRVASASCLVIAEGTPRAVCAGYLAPRIYLSQGALDSLTAGELRAVVAHELHHQRRRDPLRLLVARVLADAFFFLPALRRIGERYAALVELAADEAAVRALGERRTLARALLKFGDLDAPTVAVAGIAPERVDHLSGDRDAARWRLSSAQLGASVVAGAALIAAAAFLLVLPGPPVEVPRVLAQSCMLLVAAGAVAAAIAAGRTWRTGRDGRATG